MIIIKKIELSYILTIIRWMWTVDMHAHCTFLMLIELRLHEEHQASLKSNVKLARVILNLFDFSSLNCLC